MSVNDVCVNSSFWELNARKNQISLKKTFQFYRFFCCCFKKLMKKTKSCLLLKPYKNIQMHPIFNWKFLNSIEFLMIISFIIYTVIKTKKYQNTEEKWDKKNEVKKEKKKYTNS